MLVLAQRWTLPAEKAWPYGDRCLTSTRTPRRPSHERQYLPNPRRTQHPPRPLPLPLRRTRTPPPGPHPAAAGRWLPLGHHRRRPLLLHPDHRPLEEALREEPPRRPARPTARPPAARWAALAVGWAPAKPPRAFGLLRSRWCCAVVALLLWRTHRLAVSRETVRRWLHHAVIVWRRPRPVLKRRDPQRAAVLDELR